MNAADPFVVEGHASLFGVVDLARDRVERGAFAEALARRGPGEVKLLWQHDPAQPVGRWTEIREDARGLFVRGRLNPGVARARELAALLAQGALDGLSIGFRTVRARTDPATRVRRLVAVDLLEVSIVTFPMLPGARIARTGTASLAETIRATAETLFATRRPR
jgi:HK97 family phage prohead protease